MRVVFVVPVLSESVVCTSVCISATLTKPENICIISHTDRILFRCIIQTLNYVSIFSNQAICWKGCKTKVQILTSSRYSKWRVPKFRHLNLYANASNNVCVVLFRTKTMHDLDLPHLLLTSFKLNEHINQTLNLPKKH